MLIIILVVYLGVTQAVLTSTLLVLDRAGNQPVQMTCLAQELPFLSWYYDNTVIATFMYTSRIQFPLTILNQSEGIIKITNASGDPESDDFSAVSVLTTTIEALSLLGVGSIQCGATAVRSQAIDPSMLEFQSMCSKFHVHLNIVFCV